MHARGPAETSDALHARSALPARLHHDHSQPLNEDSVSNLKDLLAVPMQGPSTALTRKIGFCMGYLISEPLVNYSKGVEGNTKPLD